MTAAPRLRLGLIFALSLLTSWTAATGLLALAGWADRHAPHRLTTWAVLWVFTVAAPAVQSLRVHRRLGEVLQDWPATPPRVRHDLEHTRYVMVMCGVMTVVLVVALRFGW